MCDNISSWFIICKMIGIPGQDRKESLSERNNKLAEKLCMAKFNSHEDGNCLKVKGISIITECGS